MSVPFSFSLFFVSFAPLWFSIMIIDSISIAENPTNLWTEKISIFCICIGMLICLLILYQGLRCKGKSGTVHHVIKKVVEEKTITSEYLLSYILPLFAFDFKLWSDVLLFLIFFGTLAFLCIRHNHFSVNIVLEFFKYRYYVCTLANDDGHEIVQHIISRRRLNGCIGEDIYLKSLNNECKLDVVCKHY